ncbi:MAG: protease pro-enzyme activation domain-containing protein [Candidatus Eremiobacteraeota bacterium]|nr:protease pro-enzyme activation domain-containing protein [Candidatus Eremiobacteraeota bacterium]
MNHAYPKALLALVAATFALTACGGGSPSAIPQQQTPPQSAPIAPYNGPAALADFTWGKDYLTQSQLLGPAKFDRMTVDVMVKMRDENGLLAFAKSVSDPQSGSYRHFITPQEIGDRFGASATDYAKVAKYFHSNGLSADGWPQRETMIVTGTQAQLETAFGTKFGLYRRAGQEFVAPTVAPHFTTPIPVTGVTHLMNAQIAHTYIIRGSAANFGGYSPAQLAQGFDYSGAYKAGYNGTGITLGIIGTGPISSKDVPAFGKIFNAPVATVTQAAVNPQPADSNFDPNPTGLTTPPAVTAPCAAPLASVFPTATCNPEDGEAQLDTEQQASLAPGSSVLFYLAFNNKDCGPNAGCPPGAIGIQGLFIADDEIQQAIADNNADALSLSYGGGEINNEQGGYINPDGTGFGPTEFASLASLGIAVFVSSGDTGAEECFDPGTGMQLAAPCVSYPSGDPSVVSVGGVNAPLDNTGKLIGQIAAWADQTTNGGNGTFQNNVGSGGGVSTIFKAPASQALNVAGATMREQPDLSLMADPNTGPAILLNVAFGAQAGASGGTSAAAPEAAAMWALVLQACKANAACATAGGTHPYRLGDPKALIYAIYGTKYAPTQGNPGAFVPTLPYAQVFDDVLYGGNGALPPSATPNPNATPIPGCCQSGPGYDMVTGVGVPFAGHLIQSITGQAAP